MKKIKILLCTPLNRGNKGVVGGISMWANHLMAYSVNDNSLELQTLSMDRSRFANVHVPMVKRLWFSITDYIPIIFSFKKKLKNEYDLIHIASSASLGLIKDIIMLIMSKEKGVKTVLHFHFGRIPELSRKDNWEWKLLKKAIRIATEVIVLDKKSFICLKELGYSNIELLPNPLGEMTLNYISIHNGIQRDECTVLFVGHVMESKGVYELLDLCKEYPNVLFKFVGPISDEAKLRIETEYAKNSNVILCGVKSTEEVLSEMLKCTIFVLPSYTEGFPNVILESMACGCPIIATNVGAIPEMLNWETEEPCGFCIEPRNGEQLYNAISALLNDPSLTDLLGKRAQGKVLNEYSINSVWNRTAAIWRSIVLDKV